MRNSTRTQQLSAVLIALAFWLVTAASAQVSITSANPSSTQPGSSVSLAGTGFPSGTITASNVSVTITPPAGNGSPVTTAAGALSGSGSSRTVVFLVPTALTVSQPTLCQVTLSGTQSGAPFASSNFVNLTIQPPPTVTSASPAAGQLGTTVTIAAAGSYTHFTSNTALSLAGPGTTGTATLTPIAGTAVFTDASHVSAQFAIPANATPGSYTVIAKTGTEKAALVGGFLISSSAGLSFCGINPISGVQGAALSINLCGTGTHFLQGVTQAYFGDGITPVSIFVPTSTGTSATVSVTIDPLAYTGPRTITVATGGEFVIATNGFAITPSAATIQSISVTSGAPGSNTTSGAQGTNETVTLTGAGTHWTSAATSVGFGPGINVGNISVISPTSLTVNISISPGATLGSRSVTATTSGENASLANAFNVLLATPYLSGVSPNAGTQGQQNLNVTMTGVLTSFSTGSLAANFGPNIAVNSVTAISPTSAIANISIGNTATAGGRTAVLTSNSTDYSFSFTVSRSAAAITGLSPASSYQGASVALQVTGSGTNWVQGLTMASIDPVWITINRVVVNSSTTAEVDITISALAPTGARTLTLSTGGETESAGGFTVLPYTPTVSVYPATGMIGTATTPNTVHLSINGSFTHFNSQTTATIDGNGATLGNFQVPLIPGTSLGNPVNATADLTILSTAPATPQDIPCPNRTLTFTTPYNGGSEIVTTGFCVTSTPAQLTGISPATVTLSSSPVTLNVEITGQYTHFLQGVTTVTLGPSIIINGVTVNSATDLTANITIPANAQFGDRTVFVGTIGEQLTITLDEQLLIGFRAVPPATASVSGGVSPSSADQGQSLTVNISGTNTNFNSSTIVILGAGVTVNTTTVNGPTSITAQISIDPLTPAGGRPVTLVTPLTGGNEEVVSASSGFSVTAGIAAISTVGTSNSNLAAHQFALYQGSIVSFQLVGNGSTHWLQGETTVSFGCNVAVSQLQVMNPGLITLQAAVAYTASTGFCQVAATTSGEIAPSFSDSVNILAAQATSVNITPNSAPQGTTTTIQVNGIGTHWTSTAANPANNTTASFGNNNGLNITAINVISPTQMNLTLQILGTAYLPPAVYGLTITTTGIATGPQSTEQITANNIFSVSQGAGIVTRVTPTSGPQGSTAQITVTGQLTSFLSGVTTAVFSTGGCLLPVSAGINVTNVTAASNTSATLSIAISPTAPTGYQTLCMYTLGETVSYATAFQVLGGVPTLNEVAPVSGEQAQTLNSVQIVGQFTNWNANTMATFGQGITVQNLQVTSPTTATANLIIDPLAYTGGRQTTMTTGAQIVNGNFFSVAPGPAVISAISPAMANQGQHILMTITGESTHWSQGLTQFSISGGGSDITVNGFIVNNALSATADLTITGTASLGTRSLVLSTGGETALLNAGFLVTGGVPSIISVSPGSGRLGDTADEILITGIFTHWTPSSLIDFGDPCITVAPIGSLNGSTWDTSFNLTAVITIGNTTACTASLGIHIVTVRTGSSVQTGQFTVYAPPGSITPGGVGQPPIPSISYEYPSAALVGQTLSVTLTGSLTNWLPNQTTASFGAGITLNSFQVTSLTSAAASITLASTATVGPRAVTITTGSQVLSTSFYINVGQPAISFVSPPAAIQGETRLVDLVGQYTTWSAATQFTTCAGVTIGVGTVQIFGPTAARIRILVDPLANTGGCAITATTGTEVVSSGIAITPAAAEILSVTPNTAIQGSTGFVVSVTGFGTLWNGTTSFSFGSGVTVTGAMVNSNTTATLTLSLDPYASPGFRSLSATTGGQVVYLNNAFVVQPGTPILVSSTPNSGEQQANFNIGILGQYTSFGASTTVVFPNGGVSNVAVNVTSAQSITVTGTVSATAYPGCGNLVVTTPGQSPSVLTLYSAFCITSGPAAITQLSPASLGQGQTGSITITGTNTNFQQGTTVANFGNGVSVASVTVNSNLSATATVVVSANATPELNSVTLTTTGETATGTSIFTIFAATPIISLASVTSGAQGSVVTVNVTGSFTHFSQGNTTAMFGGPDITTSVNVTSATTATITATISPTAALVTRSIQLITNLSGGSQEIATKANAFTVTPGNAVLSSAVPTSPATVHQNDTADIITITGSNTHFAQATLTNASVLFCNGITTANVTVNSNTSLTVTVNVGTYAPAGGCGVTVSAGGEISSGSNLFNILTGLPLITQVSPASARQGDTNVSVSFTGLYTHFNSGALTATIPGGTLTGAVTATSSTSATAVFNFSSAATIGGQTATVSDSTDGTLTAGNAFTIDAGVPALVSASPNTLGQGVTQNVTLTGAFTSFSASSAVGIAGSLVTAGTIVSATPTQIVVPITVAAGAAAGARTISVTTGAQNVQLASAITIQAGVPNITQISPNIGVPNSTVPVTLSGIFTNWASGSTTVSFGSGITANVTGISATSITANLVISSGAAIGPVNVVVTTGAQMLTATNGFTVQNTTTTAPVITYVTPASGASGVPTNTQVSVSFSEPLNPATVPSTGANAFITDGSSCYAASGLPATVSLDVSGRILTIAPTSALAVSHAFYIQLNSYGVPAGTPMIADQSGNLLSANCYRFTTGFVPDTSGPTFVSGSVPNNATSVPTNVANIQLGFDKAINPATEAAGLSIMGAGNGVSGVWSYNTNFTVATFVPTNPFLPNTAYTVAYTSALTDDSGIGLTNPGTLNFTTAAGDDATSGSFVSWTPPTYSNSVIAGTNPTIRFTYNKPVNPLTVAPSNFYLYDQVNGTAVTGTTVSWTPDYKTFLLTLPGALQTGTNYYWYVSGSYDWLGNHLNSAYVSFATSTGPDTTAPTVVSVSPSSSISCGASPCAPINSKVEIQFSELMDPTSLTTGAVTVTPTSPAGPAVTGTFSFSPDGSCTVPTSSATCNFSLLRFTPSSNLNPNTTYQIGIPSGALADLSGNFDPFTSTFTTGSSSTADTTGGTVTSITPGSSGTNVPLNTNVVITLSKPVNPLTVSTSTFRVFDSTASGSPNIPGTFSFSANQQTITFAQANPYEPNHQICVYVSYNANLYDLAGNAFNYKSACFTTGTGTDTVAPTVLSASPQNGQTGIGPNNPVMVTFSKSINIGTLYNNVALYTGSTLYTQDYSYSTDGTTVVFSTGNLPFSTTFTIVVNPNVTDLAGNQLAAQFLSMFTTPPQPVVTPAAVSAMRPGNGATGVVASNPLSLFMSAPVNPATVNSGTLLVSQNGFLVTGTISVAAGNQDITFTPTGGAFTPGALITVFLTSGVIDANGNSLNNYQSQFTIAPSLTSVAPTLLSMQPSRYSSGDDTTTVVDLLFSKPLNPSTVNGSNFFVKLNGSTLVPGSISLLDGGRLLRFKPSAPLTASSYYYVFATTDLQDTTGLNFTGGSSSSSYLYYFATSTTSNSAPPSVSATAPTNGATGIGTNALVSVSFSENVDQLTLDPANVTLSSNGTNIPLSIGYTTSSPYVMTVTPQAPLPPNAPVTLTLSGVTDNDGDAFNPNPYSLTFTTGPAPDYTVPVFLGSNITDSQTQVPVNTGVSLVFSKPLDQHSVIYGTSVYLTDNTLGVQIPATLTAVGSSSLLLTPTTPLSVKHAFSVYYCHLNDLNGNQSICDYPIYFTTVLAPLSGGPVVMQMVPVNASNPPVNFSPMVQFDRPVSAYSLSGVTLTKGGAAVPATAQLSSGGTVLTLVPNAILSANQTYLFTVTGVQDSSGNTMSGSATRTFTTGPSFELTSPTVTIGSPVANSTTGLNPEILFTFNEQINPITSSSFTFYYSAPGVGNAYVNGATLRWAPDYNSVRIIYPGTLVPSVNYYAHLNTVCNLANNCASSSGASFSTGTSTDSSPEAVTNVNPPAGASGVPLNPVITMILAKPAGLGSIGNSSVALSPAVTGGTAVSLSSDGYTLTISRANNLAASTLYTITVPAGAFTDQDGNAVSAFSSTFTTGTSVETTGTYGSISMTSPAPAASGVAITSSITLTFSQPLNPTSLNASALKVVQNDTNAPIAGTITNPTPNTLIFTPAVGLPPSSTIYVYASYFANITDYAGNYFNDLVTSFTTATTSQTTLPQVISMSPGVNATNVGPYAPVSVTFNESISQSTITAANFNLYNGSTLLSPGLSYSSDRRTVTFNTTLPYNSTIQLAVNTSVTDYAGNNMANPYTASFTTQPQPLVSAPSVTQFRPGSGAALSGPITLFMSAPMNLSTVQAGMYVAQNGALIPGNVTLTADLRAIVWTPQANYAPGALIEAYLTTTATDTSGNAATAYKLTFTTQAVAASVAPTEVSVYPARNIYSYITNPVIDIQFSKALNPSTISAATFKVTAGSGPGGAAVAGTLSLLNGNTLARFIASAPYPASNYYYVTLTNGIQDTTGDAFAGDGYYFYVYPTATLDNTPPSVQVTPTNASASIGDNAPVRLLFNKLIETSSVNANSVQLLNGATPIPYTLSFTTFNSSTQTVATLLPQQPLPDISTISVQLGSGLFDLTGAAIAPQTTTFSTMSGADFNAPIVISRSIDDGNNQNVPTNATFTWVFNKPLDPSTVLANTSGFYVYNNGYPAAADHVSADGKTVTIAPYANLVPNVNNYFYASGATDLNGNAISSYYQSFTTVATPNTTGPTIVATNPLSTSTTPVPTNTSIEIIFSSAVSATSLGAITLTGGANAPYYAALNNSIYTNDMVVKIVPSSLLLPNTTYVVNVSGVTDVAGNPAATTTFSFTTGPNFQTGITTFVSATATAGSGTVALPANTTVPNILDNPTITLTFSNPIDYATLLNQGIKLLNSSNTVITNITLNYALSTDQKTLTVTTSGLAPGTAYRMGVNYYTNLYDIAGYYLQNSALLYFTTQ